VPQERVGLNCSGVCLGFEEGWRTAMEDRKLATRKRFRGEHVKVRVE
jgi:hypothetical protein